MITSLTPQARPLRVSLPSIERKIRETNSNQDIRTEGLDFQKKIYGRSTALPGLRKPKLSSNSVSSKDTQTTSEDSLNDLSRITPPPNQNRIPRSDNRESLDSRRSGKTDLSGAPSEYLHSLQDISSIEEPKQRVPLPKISAKCWAVMDGKTGELLYSRKENRRREIASLTKMMNLFCVIKLMGQYKLNPMDIYTKISKTAAKMNGTSANLKTGDTVRIWDLLFGLMLPSGNDAGTALAEHFGAEIYLRSEHYKARCENDSNYAKREISNPAKYFIKFMNETAKDLGLLHTYYANPHGLVNPNNYSTAADQAKLTFLLLKQNYVKDIVNTRVHNCKIEQANGYIRAVTWENTNRLLCREGWNGVKTGITTAAGPCLSAYYKNRDGDYIIILLCSISMEIRWIEAPKLVDYAIKNRDELKPAN